MSAIKDLKKAKQYSDARQYNEKHQLLYQMVKDSPEDFYIDSEKDGIVGLTHQPTNFKIHVPKNVISELNLQNKTLKESAAAKSMSIGSGMPKLTGGGQGSYTKLPSLFGNMKSQLTKATKQVGEQAKQQKPVTEQQAPGSAASNLFPATSEFYLKKQQSPMPFSYKASELTIGDVTKTLGYSPGLWYSQNSYSPEAQVRVGNLITGLGLGGLGLLSVPVLQHLFPERFKDKGKPLGIAAALTGLAAPWLLNAPSTLAMINKWGLPKNDRYTDRDWKTMQLKERLRSDITPSGANAAIAAGKDPSRVNMDLNAPSGAPTFEQQIADPRSQFNAGSDYVPRNPQPSTALNTQRYYVGGHVDPATGEYVGGAETDSTHTRAIDPSKQDIVDQVRKLRESMQSIGGSQGGSGRSGMKSGAYIPMDMEIAKTHLANVTADQMRAGYVDYGQAAGLMLRAGEQSEKPWVTVRDLADAAIGAGAGAIAGTVAAKGIGMFMNLSPTERKVMQGTGAAFGSLINLGKLGI